MDGGLISLISVGGYVASAMGVYRFQYIRTFKKYRRWQAEAPNKDVRLDYGTMSYGFGHRARKDVSYWDHYKDADRLWEWHEVPPHWLAPAWPLVLLCVGTYKALHPTVKVADPKVLEGAEKDVQSLAKAQDAVVDLDKEIAKAEEETEHGYEVGS